MKRFTEVKHPLIDHKITLVRRKDTPSKIFRELIKEISMLLAYEATREVPLVSCEVETPLMTTEGRIFGDFDFAVVPVLRAGLGMVDGILNFLPNARVGHIGIYRDHDTCLPVKYFCKLPDNLGKRFTILLDPMLATGGSTIEAVNILKENGAKTIKFINIISCPEGIKSLHQAHPDVDIYTAKIDERLNEDAYILPGLGDAGDRLFGTR